MFKFYVSYVEFRPVPLVQLKAGVELDLDLCKLHVWEFSFFLHCGLYFFMVDF